MAVLDEMEATQLTPDTWTYNTLLNVLSKAGRCDDAFALVDRMRAATPRVMQDVVTFNTLLSSCVQSGQVTPHAPTRPVRVWFPSPSKERAMSDLKRWRVCIHITTGPLRRRGGRRRDGHECRFSERRRPCS